MRTTTTTFIMVVLALTAVVIAQSGQKITGTVRDGKTRAPIVDAHVTYTQEGVEQQTTRTDSTGGFEFPNGSRGIITVQAQQYATMERSWPPRKTPTLVFDLVPPATVSGAMVDAVTRTPIDGMVTVVVHNPMTQVSVSTRTRGGAFRFSDLPDGLAIVYAHTNGFAPHFEALTVEAGDHHEATLSMLLHGAASGMVLGADGEPAVGARVMASYDLSVPGSGILGNLAGGDVIADATGGFRVDGLVPDTTATLQARLDGMLSDTVAVNVQPGMMQTVIVLRMQ